jgi:flagellar biosynthesis protein
MSEQPDSDAPSPAAAKLAVALHYDHPGVPKVVATGKGLIADKIIETAQASGVRVEENAPLAEALSQVELDQEIPEVLYRAVAEVIAFVLRASGKLPT